ncbi:MAG: hypothetical protein B7C55_00130 [Actinomycetales bacterium mxb001]|nr:MAG: hypothetical protein B7C55_00130 [Actinomycetales bacterium mxb001]
MLHSSAMRPRDTDSLNSLAARRGGVIRRTEAHQAGFDDRAISARIRAGAWQRVGRGLIVLDHATSGDIQQAWLLQVNLSDVAVITGPLAARLGGWNISGSDLMAVDIEHRLPGIPNIRLLRRAQLPRCSRTGGLRLAHRQEALVDTLSVVPMSRAIEILDIALQHRWIAPGQFDLMVSERSGRGRRGATQLQRLRQRAASGSRSEAEQRMARLLRTVGFGPWVPNHPVVDASGAVRAEIDFADLTLRIAIEVDGRAHHVDRRSFERDRARQNLLVSAGWTVLRFTWEQIVHDAAGVMQTIRATQALLLTR